MDAYYDYYNIKYDDVGIKHCTSLIKNNSLNTLFTVIVSK